MFMTATIPITVTGTPTQDGTWCTPISGNVKRCTQTPNPAGMGMLDGVLSLVSSARVGFIGMYRDEETLQPVEYFVKLPVDLDQRDAIVLDPMLATGNSTAHAVNLVKDAGASSVRLISIIAAPEGIENIQSQHPDVRIVVAAIDRALNERGYIVPGLGDAGDRLYGTK